MAGNRCVTCGKVVLIIVNVFFGILGLAMLVPGILLLCDVNMWNIKTGGALDFVPKLTARAGILNAVENATDTSNMSLDLSLVSFDLGIVLTTLGAFLLLMAIFGCSMFCCDDQISLVLYAIIMSLVIAGQTAMLIIMAGGFLNPQIKERLNNTIQNDYGGADHYDGNSLTWNFFMLEFECCGVDSYEDFATAQVWNSSRIFASDPNTTQSLSTPLACCKFTDSNWDDNTTFINAANCSLVPDNSTNNFETGCWGEVTAAINNYKIIIISVSCVVIVLQIALLVVVIVIFCFKARQDKKEKDGDDQDDSMTQHDKGKRPFGSHNGTGQADNDYGKGGKAAGRSDANAAGQASNRVGQGGYGKVAPGGRRSNKQPSKAW